MIVRMRALFRVFLPDNMCDKNFFNNYVTQDFYMAYLVGNLEMNIRNKNN